MISCKLFLWVLFSFANIYLAKTKDSYESEMNMINLITLSSTWSDLNQKFRNFFKSENDNVQSHIYQLGLFSFFNIATSFVFECQISEN